MVDFAVGLEVRCGLQYTVFSERRYQLLVGTASPKVGEGVREGVDLRDACHRTVGIRFGIS